MPKAEYLSTSQASDLLGGIDKSTISRWVASGRLRVAMRVGGNNAFLFHRRDVERLALELAEDAA